jgi:uncharacterized protein (DUF488 family)
MPVLYSLGHGRLGADAFTATLRAAGVKLAADVRRVASSRRQPAYDGATMRVWLDQAGIGYRSFFGLGGQRTPAKDSRNVGLRDASLRGFADTMAMPEFQHAFAILMTLAKEQPTAMFCAEPLWWQCHRRLIADAAVLIGGIEVRHVTPSSSASHIVTPGVVVEDGVLIYVGPSGT